MDAMSVVQGMRKLGPHLAHRILAFSVKSEK